MSSFLERLKEAPEADRWALVRDWMCHDPCPFYDELREKAPTLPLGGMTLITRYDDCSEVLRRHDTFSIAPYKPKAGIYWVAQDDPVRHWREKSIMRAILDREDSGKLRQFVRDTTADILNEAEGEIEAIDNLTRAVPVAVTQNWFGYNERDPKDFMRWSFWCQMASYWSRPNDECSGVESDRVIAKREKADKEMGLYLAEFVTNKVLQTSPDRARAPVIRLLDYVESLSLDLDAEKLAINLGGLLITATEPTSHAVVNALSFLMDDPKRLEMARQVAGADDPTLLDGFIFEALRFRPAFPYFIRTCEHDTALDSDTEHDTTIRKGTTIMALTHSAMFDEVGFNDPTQFDPSRSQGNAFHFGRGLHACLGKKIAGVMVPEVVRQVLLLPNLKAGKIERNGGPVPESWTLNWG